MFGPKVIIQAPVVSEEKGVLKIKKCLDLINEADYVKRKLIFSNF